MMQVYDDLNCKAFNTLLDSLLFSLYEVGNDGDCRWMGKECCEWAGNFNRFVQSPLDTWKASSTGRLFFVEQQFH